MKEKEKAATDEVNRALLAAIGRDLMNGYNRGRTDPSGMAVLGHDTTFGYEFALDRDGRTAVVEIRWDSELPVPSRLPGFPRQGGTLETGGGCLNLTPRVLDGTRGAHLVALVPAHRARVAATVDGPQVRQLKPEVRAFARGDHVVNLPGAEPARYAVEANNM